MVLKPVFSRELLERYKAGERVFEGINLQYADFSGISLKDLTIKDSKLFIVAFYNCDLTNAKFVNCEMVYGSFYGGRLENAVFDKCSMDLMFFENTVLKNTKMLKCTLTWSAIFGASIGELDYSSSMFLKVLTDISQITPQYVNEALTRIGPVINSLDISIKAKIKEEMQRDAAKYGVDAKSSAIVKTTYGSSARHSEGAQGYGAGVLSNIQGIINAYNAANPYQTKKEKKPGEYK